MRKSDKSDKWRTPIERTRTATPEGVQPLTERGQVFYGAKPQTLKKIVQNSVIRWFDKGEIVFEQGERTDNLPLFSILSGRFDVIHVWGQNQRHVATDGRGGLLGDVELLLRGETLDEDESAIRGLSADQTWAKIRCAAPGNLLSIWPADFLRDDHAVALALARSLARKLLLRSAIADPKAILPKSKQVALYLRRVARDLAEDGSGSGDVVQVPKSLADIAADVECAKQTVASALDELAAKYEGFSHQRSLIVVPRRFLQEPLDLFEAG